MVMEEKKKENKKITEAEFNEIFDIISGSNTNIAVTELISILAGIVNNTSPDSEDVKNLKEIMKDEPIENVISRTMLFACNTVIVSMWNAHEKDFRKYFEMAKKAAEEAAAVENSGDAPAEEVPPWVDSEKDPEVPDKGDGTDLN